MYLYLHIPFCRSRCIYCDFYVVLEKYGGQTAYVEAVLREITLRFSKPASPLDPLQTLYVGGGTPSLLSAKDYARIFEALSRYVTFSATAEITLEVNPNGLVDNPQDYRAVGFNRVSVGIQSFHDNELKKLSRLHSASEAASCIQALQHGGFENISIDLMYGIPLQTRISWQQTLETTVALGIQHVSMYGLKVEESTPLYRLNTLGAYPLPDEEATVAMYFQALDVLGAQGFERYEFSNLAQPGYASQHNLNYWEQGDFWALGASAHGMVNGVLYENIRDLKAYLEHPVAGETRTVFTPQEQLENAIIFGLRKAKGLHLPSLEKRHHIDFRKRYAAIFKKYAAERFFEFEGDFCRLTPQAIPVSNTLLAEFLG